ncbi:metal dependent phosphohydrolase [Polyplosphaeria fusca]|uniref:Metal dependent phosphohydrolase n=1 Tax=Polyplosphaeria fusca TaxID=682080 RepID=A0A9P4QI02_9PLEO|nr:metal dependent phosphohydrolase [Polyplosphaeria fusca]
MSSDSPFPKLPKSGISLPDTPLVRDALEHIKKFTSPTTVNHCIRSAYFAVLLSRQISRSSTDPLDVELVVFSTIMHDLGWATDKTLLSKDKRFEVDGADMARNYLEKDKLAEGWNKHRIQLMWDAIALHATPSFALHKEPEVLLAHIGIMADFWGPNFPGFPITIEENQEIVEAFPRLGFKEQFLDIMCGLCALKPETTYDNFVGDYGVEYGLDGKGTGKEEFTRKRTALSSPHIFYPAIGAYEQKEG